MKNLLNRTEIATVFLDDELNIRRFTPEATGIFNLIQSDIGRPISHIVPNSNTMISSRMFERCLIH